MIFADFLPNRDYNSFPSDHGPEAERQGYRHLHPVRDELCGIINVRFVVFYHRGIGRRKLRIPGFLHQAQGFADYIHVVPEVAHLVLGNRFQFFIQRHLSPDSVHKFPHREHGVGRKVLRADIVGYFFAGESPTTAEGET